MHSPFIHTQKDITPTNTKQNMVQTIATTCIRKIPEPTSVKGEHFEMLTISANIRVINRIMVFAEVLAKLRMQLPDMYFNNLQPVRLHDSAFPDRQFTEIQPDWNHIHGTEVYQMDLPDISLDCTCRDPAQQHISMDFRFPYQHGFAVLHADFGLHQQNSDDLLFKLRTTQILQNFSEQSSEIAFFASDLPNSEVTLQRGSEELERIRLDAITKDAENLLKKIKFNLNSVN